jgi:hypothetical protein
MTYPGRLAGVVAIGAAGRRPRRLCGGGITFADGQ